MHLAALGQKHKKIKNHIKSLTGGFLRATEYLDTVPLGHNSES